jgi:hypothetical protein
MLGIPIAARAAEERPVGTVKVAQGAAFVDRAGRELPARAGLVLLEMDVLRTGPDGRLGVILRDDTRLSLGPASDLRIERFTFQPAQGHLALILRMVRGMVVYGSGKIAALAPESVRFETPVGVVGVRGTTFAARIDVE